MLDRHPGPDPGSRPSPARAVSRRSVLRGGAGGLVVFALVGGVTTACGAGKPPAPDPLEAELQSARSDSELAAAAAKAAKPALAAALSEIAAERGRHATVLLEELSRAARKPIPTTTAETTSAAAAGTDKPAPAPSVRDVAEALRTSAERATKLVPTLSGYRAGLMGSIAAACTAAHTVGLPTDRKTR